MKLISQCPICKKKGVQEKSHFNCGSKRFITFDCGHTISEDRVQTIEIDQIKLADGRILYPFQREGVKFAEESNFRCLIGDEMGLGKTIQAVGSIALHYEELKPILCIVKSSLTFQWMKELITGTGIPLVQVVDTKTSPLPGFGIYITSFDSLPPRTTKTGKTTSGLIEKFKPLGLKTLVIDECQMMKNHLSNRTQAIRDLVRNSESAPEKLTKDQKTKKISRVEMIARDLMRYHGLENRFTLEFNPNKTNNLGLCCCKPDKDGTIRGQIILDRYFAEHSSDDEIIEIILHEIAHAITPGAGHRPIWTDTAKIIGASGAVTYTCEGTVVERPKEPSIKHIIALSGTPIKNNAVEYFPILNLLRPEMFPNRDRYIARWVDHYWDGNSHKAGGIRFPEEFSKYTNDFIIRRLRKDVLPDLPRIQRDFKYHQMGAVVTDAYNKKVKELADYLDSEEATSGSSFENTTNLLARLQILRHITGLSKIEPTLDYLEEFFEENPDGKITVFHHHIDVGEILYRKCNERFGDKVIRMISADDSTTRQGKIEQFRADKQIMIAPTLACGEGINLQFCNHAIIMEREWNPANEEQAEGRFSRIGSVADSVLINYPTATETIDEFFAELVERKREIVGVTLDGSAEKWDQSSVMKELANLIVKKWRNN